MRSLLPIALIAAGCASGGTNAVSDAPGHVDPDARVYLDGPIEPRDARPPLDAAVDAARPIDAAIDARPPIDAASAPDACVPHTSQLLQNPVFDLAPAGASWNMTPIDPTFPLVSTGGHAPQTTPYEVWLGGVSGTDLGVSTVSDFISQDVVIPPGTTQLVLTGYYTVATSENPNDAPYDTANLDLLQPNGTPIEAVLAVSNLTNTGSAWVPFSHTFTTNVSGATVRVRMTSTNDITNATSFYFDTFALTATHCP